MPNMNSYTYMYNHKLLNDKPNETGINNCNCLIKILDFYQIIVKRNA